MYFHVETRKNAYEIRQGSGLSSIPHIHNHIEIVYLQSGETAATADLKTESAFGGDLFFAFPNQVHYYVDAVRPVNHRILIVSPDICPEFSIIFKEQLPENPVYKNAAANPRINAVFENIFNCRDHTDEYFETELRGCMLILLSELFRNMTLVENNSGDTNFVKDIINYCYDNYDSDVSLQTISEELHISRFYVSRMFSKRLKISLSDYINSIRVQNACKMLKNNEKSITEIATSVGYNSVRTFDRCFMKIKGVTPKEYRANVFRKKKSINE